MSDQVDMTPEARWRHLRENGPKSLVDLRSNELIDEKPRWLDEEKFAKSKEVVLKYLIGVQYSSLTGLLLILQLPDGLEPLLVTGNSKDIPSLYKRYLSTIVHVQSWYEDDVFNPDSKGYKSIRQVRAMHKRVQTLMNDKFQVPDMHGGSRRWFNHYEVSMTQFAFIGLALLYPEKSAMIAATHEELELINYYWRVLGHLIGVGEEFNLCQFDKYEDIAEFYRLIFEHEYKDNFKKAPCQMGLEMTQSICVALHYFMPLVTFNNLAHWWSDCFKFNGYEPQPMSAHEKVLDVWAKVSMNHLLKSEGFLRWSTKVHKWRFAARLKNKDKVYDKLRELYKDNTKLTYYSERVDYFNKRTSADEAQETTLERSNNNNSAGGLVHGTGDGCPFGYSEHGVGNSPALVTNQTAEVSA